MTERKAWSNFRSVAMEIALLVLVTLWFVGATAPWYITALVAFSHMVFGMNMLALQLDYATLLAKIQNRK